jgi:hypothetical protein
VLARRDAGRNEQNRRAIALSRKHVSLNAHWLAKPSGRVKLSNDSTEFGRWGERIRLILTERQAARA